MPYSFQTFKEGIKNIEKWLSGEFFVIRTGRATAAIFDSIRVESYGARVQINHIAGISIEDAKTIRVTPWDKNQIKDIEAAISKADLGVSVSSDGEGLRIMFPELTSERRKAFIKLAKSKTEEARTRLRRTREDVWNDIQEKERAGELSEDEKFFFKDEMQKIVDEANKSFEVMLEKKEKEIIN